MYTHVHARTYRVHNTCRLVRTLLLGDGRKQNATITSCPTKAIVPQTIHEKTESQVPKRAQARLSARFQTPANELLIGCPGYTAFSVPRSQYRHNQFTNSNELATFQKLLVWTLVSMGKHVPDSKQ